MTDSMHFPTLKNSLGARQYYRDKSNKSVLLYQHITPDCICFFTKSLLCGVSEAVHMLDGVLKQISSVKPYKNVCDNAGRSDFIHGIAPLLNIDIWSRLSSRQNLKLWGITKNHSYTNINSAITGIIRPDYIDTGWLDMMWILASIMVGKAAPSLVVDHLRRNPNHPANKGFNELGKMFRTIHMLQYGMDMELRKIVMRYTARRETWNQFTRDIFGGFGGLLQEKDQEDQEEAFWFLTVVQNAIVLWNAFALEQAISKARRSGLNIVDEDLKHVLPTALAHINFVGQLKIDTERPFPFNIVI